MKLEEKTDDMPDKTKYHVPRAFHEELSQILKKIGDKSETQQVQFLRYSIVNHLIKKKKMFNYCNFIIFLF